MPLERSSLRSVARLAGIFLLLNQIGSFIALFYVRPKLVVFTDAAATAVNLHAGEALFRLGMAANLAAQIFLFCFGLCACRLFYDVSESWRRVLLTSILLVVAIAVTNLLNNFGAHLVITQGDLMKAFTNEQQQAFIMLFLRLGNYGQGC